MPKKLIQFYASERAEEMMREIQEKQGYSNRTAVIIQAIITLHGEIFKDYIYKKKPVILGDKLDINEKKALKNKELFENNMFICEALNGEAYQDASGNWNCKYFTYSGKKRYEQKISFNVLSEELINSQYYPSKEKVEKLQKDKLTEY